MRMIFTEQQLKEAYDELMRRDIGFKQSVHSPGLLKTLLDIAKLARTKGKKPYVQTQHIAFKDDELGIRQYLRQANFRKL